MKLSREHRNIIFLVLLAILFSVVHILTHKTTGMEYDIMNFGYAIAISIIAAAIFYWFQVYLPATRQRRVIKNNFKRQYSVFKQDVISILLSVLESSYDSNLPIRLCDLNEFRKYFKEDYKIGQTRWDGVLNKLDEKDIKELLVELEILMNELDYVLNNIEIDDKVVFSFLKRLKNAVYRTKSADIGYNETFLRFLWELFAGWSFVEGYRNEDVIKAMINKI